MAESARRGYLDGQALAGVFAWLRPNDLVWNYVVNNYLLGSKPPAFDVLYWNQDAVRLAAGLHRDFVRLALDNSLTRAGGLEVLGSPVDLRQVDVDSYIVAGLKDHIVPWENAYRSTQLLGGEKRFVLSTSGHIQALVNPPAPDSRSSYRVAGRAPGRPAGVPRAGGQAARKLVARLRRVARAALGRPAPGAQEARRRRAPRARQGTRHLRPRELTAMADACPTSTSARRWRPTTSSSASSSPTSSGSTSCARGASSTRRCCR